jgi:hypothetical protein
MFFFGRAFKPDRAPDWWNFGVSVLIAISTLFAVSVAVLDSRRAILRAVDADARADEAQAKLQVLEDQRLRFVKDGYRSERLALVGRLPALQSQLRIADDYGDAVRPAQLSAEIEIDNIRILQLDELLADSA